MPKTETYLAYESVLQIMKLKQMNTSKAWKRKLKVKIYSIVNHLTMYVCKLERNECNERQDQLVKYNRKLT